MNALFLCWSIPFGPGRRILELSLPLSSYFALRLSDLLSDSLLLNNDAFERNVNTIYQGFSVPISLALSSEELNKLKERILQSNLRRVQSKTIYEDLRVSDGDIQLIVYKSGKVVNND